jgi:putative CocE/NonD family hydrolase
MISRNSRLAITCFVSLMAVGCDSQLQDVQVDMRDGVKLLTDIYLPEGAGPFPVIMSRVPYGTKSEYIFQPQVGEFFAKNGFAYVTQNVRGRFGSEGEFTAYTVGQEIPDAYDTIAWIVEQDWSDGNVGVMGESYYGYTTLAAAASGHPAIKAISPANITLAREKQALDGAYPIQASGLWTLDMDDAVNGEYQDTSRIDLYHLPLVSLGEAYELRDVLWRERVIGYQDDPATRLAKAQEDYNLIRVPALHFGGWYDAFTRGSIAVWDGVRKSGQSNSDRQWLVMGPWDHDSMSAHLSGATAPTTIGRRDYGAAAASSYGDLMIEFFNHFLKGEENGFTDRSRVIYFNIGEDDWRNDDHWPPQNSARQSFYFHSAGGAESENDGLLSSEMPVDEPTDSYRYDPRNPVTITEDISVWSRSAAQTDRAELLTRNDVLTFETEVLEEAIDITGPITVEIYASSSAPDTDFTAALVDVYPDGYSLLIQEGILRASLRDKGAKPSSINPDEIYPFLIDLWATSYTVPAGHSIRVEISSSNFPRFARNLNNGEPLGMSDRIEIAEQTIYHTKEYPSRLLLPVVIH